VSFRIAINGLGRIGRSVLRAYYESSFYENNGSTEMEIVVLNELADIKTLAHLTRYDSTHGRFPGTVEIENEALCINGNRISVTHIEDLSKLPWAEHNIDLVMECTGTFTSREKAEIHIQQGASGKRCRCHNCLRG
jgi:D-erythrose 4-phosphate dehydrogenase